MKSFIFAVALLACCSANLFSAEPTRVMSFNIRFGSANDGENHWDKRKELVADTVREFKPDLMGTQETLKFQADFLLEQLEGYTYFGRSRMKDPNEHCGIFYKTDRFTWLAGGHFWLSETPSVPASKSWDSSLPRMVSWVLLGDNESEAGDPILFVNTHFDHRGAEAREESGRLIRRQIEQLRGLAENPLVILTGDFNTAEASKPYAALLDGNERLVDTYRKVHVEKGSEEGTFGGWVGRKDGARIDWIFADSRWKVESAEIDHMSRESRYPSDHYPVNAVLSRP